MRFVEVISALVVTLAGTVSAHAQDVCSSANAALEWSDEANPSGSWSYREGGDLLPHVDDWDGATLSWHRPQQGWAYSNNGTDRLPAWFRSNGYETFVNDIHRCDVVVHTTDSVNGVGNDSGTLQWTSPGDATIAVAGAVWMGREEGRGNQWELFRNDTLLTGGNIASGDEYSRASPFRFENGSGGTDAVRNIDVEAGDTIRLVLTKTSFPGDFTAVKMRILCEPLPETSTTTTTLFYPLCGDPLFEQSDDEPPYIITASDALHVLRTAVALVTCDVCVCDANDSGGITATDALLVLRAAVGSSVELSCPFCPC